MNRRCVRPALLCVLVVCATPAARVQARMSSQAADQAGRLVEPNERAANAIQPPEVVMDLAGVRPGLVIGEIGAGDGRVTVHLATRVGPSGKIYANDIDRRALDSLARRVARLGLSNVEVLLGAVDDTRFPEGALDMVIMVWVFHHVEQPVPLLTSALRSLKPSGVIVLVEPLPKHSEPGARRLTRELVAEEAGAAGLRLDAMIEGTLREDNVFMLRRASQEGGNRSDPPSLSADLKILEPLVNKEWVGEATAPDGSRLKVERAFEVIWDGSVVRYTAGLPGSNSSSEGFFYWDREAQTVATFMVNSRGVYQRGTVSRGEDGLVIEGRIVFPDRAFDYRNTFELRPDGTLVDRWFQNAFGSWQAGHVFELTHRVRASRVHEPPVATLRPDAVGSARSSARSGAATRAARQMPL